MVRYCAFNVHHFFTLNYPPCFRGYEFRRVYSSVAQLRSFLPTGTPMIALTATASFATKKTIVQSLHFREHVTIAQSPDRPNIHYSVVSVSREVNVTFKRLLLELKKERSRMLKVIVFCKSITSCVALYKYFLTELREDSYEPPRSTPSTNTRLFAMFHARIDEEDKETILKSFCNPSVDPLKNQAVPLSCEFAEQYLYSVYTQG